MRTWRFDGHIAGIGTAAGTRIVIGMWDETPFGALTDLMIEDAGGHRTLIAPTQQTADFIGATYGFDTVRIEPVALHRDDKTLRVQAPSVSVTLVTGGRTPVGRLLSAVPRRLSRSRTWLRLLDPFASRMRRGVHTHGQAGPHRHEYYAASDEHTITSASAFLEGADLGELTPVEPAVRFGFASTPRAPAIVRVTTMIDEVTS